MVFQLGAGIERERYISIVRVFFENTNVSDTCIHTDGEMNRDGKNRTPDSVLSSFA